MAPPDFVPKVRIETADSVHDDAVFRLAEENGLRVDPSKGRSEVGACWLVALSQEDAVVGFVAARILFDEMEIFDFCVEGQARRQGIGRALLEELFIRAKIAGVSDVFLEVRITNHAARALYLSVGFSEVGSRERYYGDGEDAALFRCCLAPSA